MLVKLSAFMSKVPHYVLVLALAVTIWGPSVITAITGTPLATYADYVVKAIAFCTAILALAKQFNPWTPEAVASDKGIEAKGPDSTQPMSKVSS